MIRNYLTIIYRNTVRQFSYSFINIAGLAVGLSCSLVIFLYVYGEWNYDRGFAMPTAFIALESPFSIWAALLTAPEALLNVLPRGIRRN